MHYAGSISKSVYENGTTISGINAEYKAIIL
jgi:hypothetical protein